ncbi:autotransporter outer membrane beta-barrel domain-containing protein [Bartonella sp. 1-1C]|uniref:autotransporter outer membrane beta-barrel domain-containing protein n=1 Tax=Bartonella sp. 1-1C TaxID=515256 RepID=UPI001313F403|nr:autotransporter outer membrane beta-barrel domain-containing protein [Bartonella sp. 1-1C]
MPKKAGKIESNIYGVDVLKEGKVVLTQSVVSNTHVALNVSNGIIGMYNGVIKESNIAVQALGKPTNVILINSQIETKDGKASLVSMGGANVEVKSGGLINFTNSNGAYTALGGKVTFDSTHITGTGMTKEQKNYAVFYIDQGGYIDFKNGNINVINAFGLLIDNTVATSNSISLDSLDENLQTDKSNINITKANIEGATIEVKGDEFYGIYFRGENPADNTIEKVNNAIVGGKEDKKNLDIADIKFPIRLVNLKDTKLNVVGGSAIYSAGAAGGNISLFNSSISADHLLLMAEKKSSVLVLADNSLLTGGSYVDESSTAEFYLSGNSVWFLTQTKQKNSQDLDNFYISVLGLDNSSINFKRFKSPEAYNYKTLHIGKGVGDVYIAKNNAQIHLNTSLSFNGSFDSQKTDRVLIHGNVYGETTIDIQAISENRRENVSISTDNVGNTQGISLIQVSGTAQERSFKLKGDYITVDASPYRYKLFAYGPSSQLGQADPRQKLVGKNEEKEGKPNNNFWDYRLQSEYISLSEPELEPVPPAPAPSPEPPVPKPAPAPSPEPSVPSKPEDPIKPDFPSKRVLAVVPQLPSYLLLPHALFHTGLVDVSNQRELLEIMQSASHEADKKRKTNFFIRGYGSNHRYTSNLSVFEYGYGADLDYNNATAGIVLNTLESKHSASSFGFMGGYGQLSLHPRAVKHSQKSVFDKWSGKLYANLDHDTGFYANGFISYDFFKGDVVTLSRGKTAELKGRLLNASLTGGQSIITGYHDFILEPQLQVIYQSLLFDQARDIDRFDIDLGSHDQLVGRIGGRLIKAFASSENADVVSFYTKLHVAHSYEKKRIVHFKDAFQLGAFGSTVETGTGVHAQLSNRIALHGDLLYQHKLTKAGFSGISVSGGLRYQF